MTDHRQEHLARLRGHDLADLRWHWGGAYEISWDEAGFHAARRDTQEVITTQTAVGLLDEIRGDYLARPVPRDLT